MEAMFKYWLVESKTPEAISSVKEEISKEQDGVFRRPKPFLQRRTGLSDSGPASTRWFPPCRQERAHSSVFEGVQCTYFDFCGFRHTWSPLSQQIVWSLTLTSSKSEHVKEQKSPKNWSPQETEKCAGPLSTTGQPVQGAGLCNLVHWEKNAFEGRRIPFPTNSFSEHRVEWPDV